MALTQPQIAQLWIQQGGDPKYANVMSRIAIRESGGRPGINNRGLNKNGTTDWGLFQVNDIWRRDPVVGPLFKSGKILTPAGATQAAIHILKVQGPRAWATYNPAVDAKYIGQMPSGSSGPVTGPKAPRVQASSQSASQAQAPDMRAQRASLIAQFVQQGGADNPNAVLGLAAGLNAAKAAESSAQTAAPVSSAGSLKPVRVTKAAPTPTGKGSLANYGGKQVAGWIAPILNYARAHGWQGTVSSGYRTLADQTRIYNSGVRPAAKPGTSNHEMTAFPGGAVDVTNAAQLSSILQRSPYAGKLVWAGAKDPVHFSHPRNGTY